MKKGFFYLAAFLVCMSGMTACADGGEPGMPARQEENEGEVQEDVRQEAGDGQGQDLQETYLQKPEQAQEQGTGEGQEQDGLESVEEKEDGETGAADSEYSVRFEESSQTYEAEDGTVLLVAETRFPVVTIPGYEQAAEAINSYVRGTGEMDEESLMRSSVEEMLKWAEEDYENRGKDNWYQEYTLYEGYWLQRADESVISFILETYSYTGGAHPNTLLSGFVFDTKTGERLTFADVVENEDAASAAVLQFLLEETGKEEYQGVFFEGYEETLGDLLREDTWYLGEDGFHIIANTYAIAPYVAGSFDFVIPYEQADFLRERFLKEGMDD